MSKTPASMLVDLLIINAIGETNMFRKLNIFLQACKSLLFIKTIIASALIAILLSFSLVSSASTADANEVIRIKYIEEFIRGDDIYAHWIVHCSNGDTIDITSWNNREYWCFGTGSKDQCIKEQIDIAKLACGQA